MQKSFRTSSLPKKQGYIIYQGISESRNTMKLIILIVSLVCIVVNVQATFAPNGQRFNWPRRTAGQITFPRPPKNTLPRFRREANPQGSITLEGNKPLSGPDRKPSLNLDYNHRVFEDNRGHVDAYGGANWQPGRLSPHAGVKVERNFRNGFVGGFGEVQQGPRGRPDPTFGVRGGWRF